MRPIPAKSLLQARGVNGNLQTGGADGNFEVVVKLLIGLAPEGLWDKGRVNNTISADNSYRCR